MTVNQLIEVSEISIVNDKFRKSGFGVVLTGGVQSVTNLNGLMQAIRAYSDFNEDNDPYYEHDMGSINWRGDKVFWKIDYYN